MSDSAIGVSKEIDMHENNIFDVLLALAIVMSIGSFGGVYLAKRDHDTRHREDSGH